MIAVTDKTKGTHGLFGLPGRKGNEGGFKSGQEGKTSWDFAPATPSELIFEDCEIPAENVIGAEGEGFVDAMRVLDGGRISIAALALGIGRGALDATLKYVKERRQFGKAIAEFQGIQWKLADMATELDAARLLTQRAAVLKDAGRKTTRGARPWPSCSPVKWPCAYCATKRCSCSAATGSSKTIRREKYYRDVKLSHDRRRHKRDSAHGDCARDSEGVYPSRG